MTKFYDLWVASEISRNLDLMFLTLLVFAQFGIYWLIGKYVRLPHARAIYLVSAIVANAGYAIWIGVVAAEAMRLK